MADWPFWAAIKAVREGLSASAGLRAYRAGGGRIADRTWSRMTGEARNMIAQRGDEIGRPLNRRPTSDEISTWTTRSARGFLQNVQVMVRDRITNDIQAIDYSRRSSRLISRQRVIDEALGVITPEGTDGDRQQILGAVYTGTTLMTPGE